MMSRRNFLVTGALAAGAGAVPTTGIAADKKPRPSANDLRDWGAVRRQFALDPAYTHLGLFYMAAHPRPVRDAIEDYRRQLDANPFRTVEHLVFENAEPQRMTAKVCGAIASYIGGRADDIALTHNTTTGLALLYQGLPLKPGDEILVTTHDHFVHHESIRLASERSGASWRKVPLFDTHDAIDADAMVERLRKALRPNTRVLGVTWVHSGTGLKLPIRRIADVVAEANRDRPPDRRLLLIVDGVHGLGVESPDIVAMGMDAFAAGTHKWMFGPRGTGFVWAKPEVWATMRPLLPSFSADELFAAWGQDKAPAQPARASWFSPGGFQAYEHFWALPAAFEFHRTVGSQRITRRIHELNGQMREGLAKLPHVTLYTPRTEALSSGMVCFDVKGMTPKQVMQRLLDKHRIIASTTPYAVSYARVAFGIQNTPEEVEKTLAAIRAMAA
ncbi:aminotransferase class V-fold PLP-dependent enzyme [Pyxidicoccus xibeiensis]|uniref:aminotransferase class V-fold PLP-dependent enzyme n=1 Tax=Pyxidicoccus xibeiensis TaxID=2906759 RepID=UPI0020A7066A|nr:aminotransferase class V-fold PLP-dependent enzyme [Pyxidicoccus xibeiensis]MCP3137781.1 aminotransferase class V-fold PLP-dependent enzyme [Pyxidicoccus xibeiensis]